MDGLLPVQAYRSDDIETGILMTWAKDAIFGHLCRLTKGHYTDEDHLRNNLRHAPSRCQAVNITGYLCAVQPNFRSRIDECRNGNPG